MRIRGYILPPPQQSGLTRFVLVRDNMACCFGPGAAIYDSMIVQMPKGLTMDYTVQPIMVEGTFNIQEVRFPNGRCMSIYHVMAEKRSSGVCHCAVCHGQHSSRPCATGQRSRPVGVPFNVRCASKHCPFGQRANRSTRIDILSPAGTGRLRWPVPHDRIPLGKNLPAAYCRPAYAKHGRSAIRSLRRVSGCRNIAAAVDRLVSHDVRLGDGRQFLDVRGIAPVDLWPLAWIAPVPWLMLARRAELTGRKPYRAIWLAGFAVLAGRVALAAAASLGDELWLGGAVVLFGVLYPAVRRHWCAWPCIGCACR